MAPTTWMIVISIYVLIAAGVPVWLILQPRDFINVQILYGGIGLMIVSLVQLRLPGAHRDHAAVQPGRRRAQPRLHLADDVHHHRLRGHFGVPLPRRRRDDGQAAVRGARRPARRLQRHAPRVAALGLRPPRPRRGHGLLRLQGHRLADRPGRQVQSRSSASRWPRASSSTRAWASRSLWARSSASCSSRASSSRPSTPPSGSTATFSRSSGRSSSGRCRPFSSITGSTRACRSS